MRPSRPITQALQLALAQGEPVLRGMADLYLGLSELYRECGDMDTAIQNLLRSEELGEPAALPDWRYRTGKYFVDSKVAQAAAQAADPTVAKKLWDVSSVLVKLTDTMPAAV